MARCEFRTLRVWLARQAAAIVVAALAGALAYAGPLAAQEAVQIPGTSVTITPPDGFSVSADFQGLANAEKQGSFLVAEFPAEAAAQLGGLFADESNAVAGFAAKGITVKSREEIDNADGDTVPILRGSQEANGVTLDKWMALYAGEKVVMITFQIPEANALDEDAMRGALASVRLGGSEESAEPADERLASLPFEFDTVEPFRIGNVNPGVGVMLTVGPNDIDDNQPQVVLNFTKANPAAKPLEPKEMANITFDAFGDDVVIESQEEEIFAGLDGWKTTGTVVEKGIKKRFMHWIASVDETTAAYAFGYGPEDGFGDLQDAVEEMAGSYELKE